MSNDRPPCADTPQLFDGTDPTSARRARTICAHCPAILSCAKAGVDHRQADFTGTWAGVTYGEQKVATCGTDGGYYRHLRKFKNTPCEPCRAAHRIVEQGRIGRRNAARDLEREAS